MLSSVYQLSSDRRVCRLVLVRGAIGTIRSFSTIEFYTTTCCFPAESGVKTR
jgi:hypothetical protein